MATAAELAIVLKAKDEASAVLKKVSAETASLGKAGADANKGLSSLASGFKGAVAAAAGIAVAVGGVTALTSAVSSAVGSAIDFEQAMSGIKAVSGASGQQMQQLSKLALDLGRDTSFSAQEAAGGISELVKGGVSIGDVFGGAASAALDLAAAGGVSVGEAATIAANAMNQFSLKGSDMAHVSDLVAGAANASSISVSDFNQSLAAGGATAALAGQSIDSFSTAVALMGAQGIKGSDAGTSLKAAINALIPTTTAAKDAMRELGIITADGSNQFINAQGQMKSFREIGDILQTSLAGLTDSQRLYNLELIFGQDGQRAAAVLAKAGAAGFDVMASSMLSAGGAAEIARERLNNAAGDIEQLKGSLETAAITVGSLFLPAIRSIAQTMTGAVNAFTQEASTLIVTSQNIAGAHGIGMIPAALTAVELRIGEVFGSGAQQIFHDARAAVETLAATFTTVAAAADTLADATGQRLAPALETVRQAAEGAAPVMEQLRATIEASSPVVGQLTSQYADWLVQQGLVTAETAKLSGAQQQQMAVTDALWAILRNNPISGLIDSIASLGAQIQSAQAATGELASATDTAWKAMIAATGAVRDGVAAKLGELAAFIRGLGPSLQADAVSVGVSIVNGIVAGLNPSRVIAASVALAQSAIAAARSALAANSPSGEFEDIGQDVVAGLADGIEGVAGDAVAAVEDMVAGMESTAGGFDLVDSILGGLNAGGQDALANFLHDSERVIEDVGRRTAEVGRKAGQAVSDAMRDAADSIIETRDRAQAAIDALGANQAQSRSDRSRRDVFGAGQDAERTARERAQEEADLLYEYQRDRRKATTDDEKAAVDERFADAKADLARRRAIADDNDAFRKKQADDLQKFNDMLEDEALQRQVKRIQDERDSRIKEIGVALDEKIARVRQNEKEENEALRKSADEKLADLKERFYDKVGPLNAEQKTQFEATFLSLKEGIDASTKAANALVEALSRAANIKISAPSVGAYSNPATGMQFPSGSSGGSAYGLNPSNSGGSSDPPEVAAAGGWGNYNAKNQGAARNPDGTVKKATGGPVSPGMAYRVGETGWGETFVPQVAGKLVTENQVAMAAGGGQHGAAPTVEVPVYLDGRLITRVVWNELKAMRLFGTDLGLD
jgi:TP901 family phage tail tape measure protein